ncbi:CASP-like protein 2A1 [Wolffia australiana]
MEMATEKNAAAEKRGEDEAATPKNEPAETVLRVASMGLCITALVITLKNTDSSESYGTVSFNDLNGLKFLVYASGICAGYSFFSALYMAKFRRSSDRAPAWTLFVCDQVLTYLLLAAATAAADLVYLAHMGNERATWSKVCSTFGNFCRLGTAATGMTFAATACYVGMSLTSSYRLFSAYDAPVTPFISKGGEIAAVAFNG